MDHEVDVGLGQVAVGGEHGARPLDRSLGNLGCRLGQQADLADREGVGGTEPVQLDPVPSDRDDVEGSVTVGLDIGQLQSDADAEQ